MEYYHPTDNTEQEYVERYVDVDAKILFEDRQPVAVWLRHFAKDGSIIEHTTPVGEEFDSDAIYGGLMSLPGRYQQDTLVAVQIGDVWYNL